MAALPSPPARLDLFVACLPGLEAMLAGEIRAVLREVGERPRGPVKAVPGGVELRASARAMAALNLGCGLANRVLVRLGSFRARGLPELRRKAAKVGWETVVGDRCKPVVRATCRRSRLYHSGAVAERVAEAIAERCGPAPAEAPEVAIRVRMHEDHCLLSLDSSGEALHRRGWRRQTAKAPLREDLARALLLVSGWRPGTPLVDPMMGAGTLLIEAATRARRMAPGRLRGFALSHTALAGPAALEGLRERFEARIAAEGPAPLFGRDRAAGALRATLGNAGRAGVLEDLELRRADLRDEPLPTDARALVSNPPWGRRTRGERGALRALDRRLSELPAGRVAALVWPVNASELQMRGCDFVSRLMTDHGAVKVLLLSGRTRGLETPGQEV